MRCTLCATETETALLCMQNLRKKVSRESCWDLDDVIVSSREEKEDWVANA